jgi:acyl-CoA dehydrogenase
MPYELSENRRSIKDSINRLCADFPDAYWIEKDRARAYPIEFVDALTRDGWLSMLVPTEYGGGGASIADAAVVLEAIDRNGGSSSAAHAQMYTMGTVLRHGNDDQKRRYLPEIAAGRLRLQSFGVTEPDAGSDTTRISTFAERIGDVYVVNGRKMWTSRIQHSDLLLLLVRTTPYGEVVKKTDGMTVLLVDMREAGEAITAQPVRTMVNHETNALFIDGLRVPVANRIGDEGRGFSYILSGMNAERILVASEYIGSGLWFIDRTCNYASQREVFGRPIGANQGVQFPLAQAYTQLEAAGLMRWQAADLFEKGAQPGFEANAAKLLASEALWAAANAAMDTFGGYGVAEEYGIERKFREARLPLVAPINNNLVRAFIAHNVLALPKSY